MEEKYSVLLVGWNPRVVDYSKWPGLTAEKLFAVFDADKERLESLGYEVELGLIDSARTAEATLLSLLMERRRHCVLIGAGVRTVEEYLPLFERLVNAVHTHAPAARICFNGGPFDSVDAVLRQIPTAPLTPLP